MALKPLVLCYPVGDIVVMTAIGKSVLPSLLLPSPYAVSAVYCMYTVGSDEDVLRDCILMRPGSRVYDVYEALKRGALGHVGLCGVLVRAEGCGLDKTSKKLQLGRETVVNDDICVLKIQTNRKSAWQQQSAAALAERDAGNSLYRIA